MSESQRSVRFINPETLPQPPGYTQVVEVAGGRTVYVSGQIALDAAGRLVGAGDFEAQARRTFENVRLALAAAGLTFDHVVKLTTFVTDFSHLATLRRVREEFVNRERPPASTAVQVAALVRPELLIEIEAVAVGPADDGTGG